MSLIAWNCRGLGNPRAVQFIKEITQQAKPSFIFLSETLTNADRVDAVRRAVGFAGCMAVDARGHSGGLALLWKNEGACVIKEVNNHYIDFEVENEQVGRWRYTGFYGCPERARRRESWDLIRSLADKSQLPWCIIGDFNDLMFAEEKRGGREHPRSLLTGFMDTVRECNLMDLGYVGEKYTWEKSRGTNNWVQERLDRGLATQEWCSMFPSAEVQVLEVATSDHLPLLLQLKKKVYAPKSKRFKFENVWLREKDCFSLVKDSWELTEGRDILDKIDYCCLKLDEWGWGINQEYKNGLLSCRTQLRKLRARRDLNGIQMYNKVRWEYLNLLEKQETYWKQRAKQFWLQEGDSNTRFFHRHASVRKRNNCIQRIKDGNGVWRETAEEIQEVVTDYFGQLFKSTGVDGKLSDSERVKQVKEEENEALIAPVTIEEVKEAVFSMHPDKSPGPDGLNPAFFQSFWSIVGRDVLKFCQRFMTTGELPVGINCTLVCLIPKIKVPQSMGDLRPISLCNVLVRILSKVLSNRLKPCLASLISDKQSAFIEGRLLTDNALIAFEVNHYMKRHTQGKSGIAGLKIDISKAYDRLEWRFVQNMMEKFGFTASWINKVMKLVQSVSYSFLQNGVIFGENVPERGLRQGDPISPYLYIMCAEGLSSIIRRNEDAGLLHGCTIARGAPTISHLLFADDCYFFFKASGAEASVMKRILNRYEDISGQKINYTKSGVTFSPNTNGVSRLEVCSHLGVSEQQNPGKYLGMPMLVGRKKNEPFSFLVERVQQKLNGWQNQPISKAGKVVLLKTAAQVIPNFWMNMFLIPMEICDGIEKVMNAFWWGNGSANKGIKWMSWERLCTVKEDGGLGFKKLREFNVAMLAKQAWRLINNINPLVTQLMRARYFPTTDFLNASIGTNPSYVWRSILESQDVVRQGCRRRIGNGLSTKIWKVPWLPSPENGFLTTELPEELKHITVQSLFDETQEGWDADILNDILNDRDRNLVRQIPISNRRREDSWFWLPDDKGKFTVRSCYRRLRGEASCPDGVFWKKLWSLKLPGKVLNLLWRTCRSCLPTAQALAMKRVNIHTVCSWCLRNVEDDIHVLFQCCFAREVWEGSGLSSLVTTRPTDTVLTVLQRIFQAGCKEHIMMVSLLCWNLWQRRNNWVWNRVNTSAFGVRSKASSMLIEWQKAREGRELRTAHQFTMERRWCKPPAGWIKINTDAACVLGNEQVGVGCIIRDEWGNFLRARSNVVQGSYHPREAETISLKEALTWTKDWKRSKCVFECDAKLLVDAVNGSRGNTYFHAIVEDCIDLLKHFDEVLVLFAHRSANMVAHSLARVSYSMSGPMEWLYTAPDFIVCMLDSDKL